MTQFLRPDATITTGGWAASSTTLHGDTSDQSDATYIIGGSGDTGVELSLDSGVDPSSSANHTVVLRLQSSGTGGPEKFDAVLLQGSTTIAAPFSRQSITRGAWTEYSYTLIAFEADSITDYTDLRVRITPDGLKSGETIWLSEASLQVPENVSSLTVQDAGAPSTIAAVELDQTHLLTIADLSAQTSIGAVVIAELGVDLTVANMSAVADVTPRALADSDGASINDSDGNAINAESLNLAQSGGAVGTVAPNDASGSATADNVTLTQTHNITVADASAGVTIDGDLDVVVTFEVSQLPGGGINAAPTIENVAITQTHILAVDDVSASPTADIVTIGDTLQGVSDWAVVPTIEDGPLTSVSLTVADMVTIGRTRNVEIAEVANLVPSDMAVVATIEGSISIEQFFSGVVSLELASRDLGLTLNSRSLGLTLRERTDG